MEGRDLRGGSAVGVVVSNVGPRHLATRRGYNHYSVLATIEANWDLGFLGYAADRAQVPLMTPFVSR